MGTEGNEAESPEQAAVPVSELRSLEPLRVQWSQVVGIGRMLASILSGPRSSGTKTVHTDAGVASPECALGAQLWLARPQGKGSFSSQQFQVKRACGNWKHQFGELQPNIGGK